MKKYLVSGLVTVSCVTIVEAENEEEALKIAKKRQLADIDISGSCEIDEYFHMDTDGIPYDFNTEEW